MSRRIAPDGGLVLGDDAVVAGESGGLLGDHAEARRVVIAAGDQRGARGRAERGGKHAVVAQAFLGDAVHGRGRDDAAEGAGHAESGVVGDDEQDVGGIFGWNDGRSPPGFGAQCVVLDHAAEFRVRRGELVSGNGRRGTWRTGLAGRLLLRLCGSN